jgi:hypothetical protein
LVPGQQILQLPEGTSRSPSTTTPPAAATPRKSIRDRPEGLAVRVSPAAGGEQLEVKHVPGWLFSSITGDRGHEPFGEVEVPGAGSYQIRVTDDDANALDYPAAASRPASKADSGQEITIGQRPWSPLGSVALDAILAGLAVGPPAHAARPADQLSRDRRLQALDAAATLANCPIPSAAPMLEHATPRSSPGENVHQQTYQPADDRGGANRPTAAPVGTQVSRPIPSRLSLRTEAVAQTAAGWISL